MFDSFFEMGGHSLRVISLLEQMRQRGLHVQVRDVFEAPVLWQLAACIGEGNRS